MIRYMVECTCKPGEPYADGNLPIFYDDASKAAYMYEKLKRKAKEGMVRIHKELVILPNETAPDAIAVQGLKPLPNLLDYNLYFGVHFQGLHVMKP